jgi:hypothetical protein
LDDLPADLTVRSNRLDLSLLAVNSDHDAETR